MLRALPIVLASTLLLGCISTDESTASKRNPDPASSVRNGLGSADLAMEDLDFQIDVFLAGYTIGDAHAKCVETARRTLEDGRVESDFTLTRADGHARFGRVVLSRQPLPGSRWSIDVQRSGLIEPLFR